jgi:arylsulfatase A
MSKGETEVLFHQLFEMNKKKFLSLVSSLAMISAGVVAQKQNQPNVIFILADDLGYGDLGCYGSKLNRTPNLDKLAENGVRFTDCYAAASISSPSRAALLTGRYPVRAGINGVFFPESFSGLDNTEITLPKELQKAGYYTGIIGKWHLGHHFQYLPLQNGFNEYFGIPYSNDMSSVVYLRGNEVESWSVDQTLLTKTYTREAINFIESHKKKPFFLYLAHNMPHVPIFASDQFKGKSANGLYGDVIEELDWSVGEIVREIRNLGLEENTLIIFSSDNGPWITEGPHGGSPAPFFQGKFTTWEGGQRVPAIAYWKGQIQPRIYTRVASLMDWFPTILSLSNGSIPASRPLDGHNLSEVLLNSGKMVDEDFCFIHNGKIEAYRSGDFKIILPKNMVRGNFWVADIPAHDTLLFNVTVDKGEIHDLFKTNKVKAAEMISKLEKFRATLKDIPPAKIQTDGSAGDYVSRVRQDLIKEAKERGVKPLSQR